jgi:hypothetical protein
VGALTGRSKRDIGFFTGKKDRTFTKSDNSLFEDSHVVVDYLGKIYEMLLRIENNRKLELEERQNKQEEIDTEENRRNEALIEALTLRKKIKVPKKPTKGPKPPKAPPAAKPTPTAPPPPKPAAPTPTAPKPTAPTAPKPTAPTAPAPTAPAPTAGKVSTTVSIIGGAVAGTAAVIGGKEALAANISKYESGKAGYNAYNKGTVGDRMIPSDKPIDFSKMTISEFLRRGSLKPGNPDRLFAVGKYQIIPATMRDLIKQLKIDPDTTYLDPSTQDSLFTNGLVGQRRKKVDDYIKGRSDDRDGAILQLAQEFASVGVPYDMTVGNKKLKKGDSYYSGIGGNKAHNSPEQVGAALDADRLKNLQSNQTSPVPPIATGQKIDSESKENTALKKSFEQPPVTNKSVNTTNINNKTVSSNEPKKEDDSNPLIKKARLT